MAPERDAATFNSNGGVIDDDGIVSETALDWFRRSQRHSNKKPRKRRRRNGSAVASDNESSGSSDSSDVDTATDPSMAARRFLRFGKSGIAPIDAVWKNGGCVGASGDKRYYSRPLRFLPPVTVLEGPKDVGKTWMLLTLAARFVVATRASRFENDLQGGKQSEGTSAETSQSALSSKSHSNSQHERNDEDDETGRRTVESKPKVLLLDSTHDFSVSQLVSVVRSTLARERRRESIRWKKRNERHAQRKEPNGNGNGGIDHNGVYNGDTEHRRQQLQQPQLDKEQRIEDELERQEREKKSMQQDMEDCLSRIHIIQVDNGPTGWVPMLEALTYELSQDRRRWSKHNHSVGGFPSSDADSFPSETPPILLLWDGFLSDMTLSSNATTSSTASVFLGDNIGNSNKSQALFDSPGAQELLRQLSRLLQKEPYSLWLVLATRTITVATTNGTPSDSSHGPATMEQSGIGVRVMEWIRKEEELRGRRRREKDPGSLRGRQPSSRQHPDQPQRASYRLRLDRRSSGFTTGQGSIPRTAAAAAALFAKVVSCGGANNLESSGGTNGNRGVVNDEKIPYSISLGGILS